MARISCSAARLIEDRALIINVLNREEFEVRLIVQFPKGNCCRCRGLWQNRRYVTRGVANTGQPNAYTDRHEPCGGHRYGSPPAVLSCHNTLDGCSMRVWVRRRPSQQQKHPCSSRIEETTWIRRRRVSGPLPVWRIRPSSLSRSSRWKEAHQAAPSDQKPDHESNDCG
jgi:hypothetical protein